MSTPQFHIRREAWRDSVSVYFRTKVGDDTYANAEPVGMWVRRPEDEGKAAPPMMEFHGPDGDQAMQSLMDELWREGFRPKDIGTAGHLAATQAHLADMRALLGKALDTKLP